MIPRAAIGLCLSFLAVASYAATAHADPNPWQFDVKASYVVLGDHAKHSTGGLMPSLTVRRTIALRENVSLGLGAHLGIFGLFRDASWVGVLGGPILSAALQPARAPVSFEPRRPPRLRPRPRLQCVGLLRAVPRPLPRGSPRHRLHAREAPRRRRSVWRAPPPHPRLDRLQRGARALRQVLLLRDPSTPPARLVKRQAIRNSRATRPPWRSRLPLSASSSGDGPRSPRRAPTRVAWLDAPGRGGGAER